MQQFVVPQFIDVEDKIFGPITTRQFLILLIGGLICFIAFKMADIALFSTVLVVVGGLSAVLAFVKVNGQTFHYFLLNILQTIRRPSMRIWRKKYDKSELDFLRKQKPEEVVEKEVVKKAKAEHIRDLALIVNTGGFYRPEEEI